MTTPDPDAKHPEDRIRASFANWRACKPREAHTDVGDYAAQYAIYKAGFEAGERRTIERLRRFVEKP